MSALNFLGDKIKASSQFIMIFAKITILLEKVAAGVCTIITSCMNQYAASKSADIEILQQDISNLSKTREQMLTVMQRIDKTVEQEVAQMVRVLQHRTEALKFASFYRIRGFKMTNNISNINNTAHNKNLDKTTFDEQPGL